MFIPGRNMILRGRASSGVAAISLPREEEIAGINALSTTDQPSKYNNGKDESMKRQQKYRKRAGV